MTKKTYIAQPILGWWRAVEILGWTYTAVAAVLAVLFTIEWSLLKAISNDGLVLQDTPLLTGFDMAMRSFGVLGLASYWLGVVLTLIWYYRANSNAHALGLRLDTEPKWAVAWFFIPFAMLFKPYGVTSELWRSSAYPDHWRGKSDPARMRWWWAAVLIGKIGSSFGDKMYVAEKADMIELGALTLAVSAGVTAVAGALFLSMGREISKRQQALIDQDYKRADTLNQAVWNA
ncbi:DUF4328 domain-containing protein [Brevundimonas sp.]|uniref:DUF4328 domain-containing protein n=1 Tax=Brevundimonas sp. TaxID=1871086 RepID=UPI003D6D155E